MKKAKASNGIEQTKNQLQLKIINSQKRTKLVNPVKDQVSMEIELPQTPEVYVRQNKLRHLVVSLPHAVS